MYQCSTATHVVYPKGHKGGRKEDAADDALHVSSEWLEKSIKVSQGCQISTLFTKKVLQGGYHGQTLVD